MTGEQADEIYEGLVKILREKGLDWIVDEAQSAILAGKTERSKIELPMPIEDHPVRRRRPAIVFRHSQRDWTSEERLAILLDAVDASVCKPITMENALIGLLPEFDARDLEFAPGGLVEDLPEDLIRERLVRQAATEVGDQTFERRHPYALRLDQPRRQRRQVDTNRLAQILNSAREELNADLD